MVSVFFSHLHGANSGLTGSHHYYKLTYGPDISIGQELRTFAYSVTGQKRTDPIVFNVICIRGYVALTSCRRIRIPTANSMSILNTIPNINPCPNRCLVGVGLSYLHAAGVVHGQPWRLSHVFWCLSVKWPPSSILFATTALHLGVRRLLVTSIPFGDLAYLILSAAPPLTFYTIFSVMVSASRYFHTHTFHIRDADAEPPAYPRPSVGDWTTRCQ